MDKALKDNEKLASDPLGDELRAGASLARMAGLKLPAGTARAIEPIAKQAKNWVETVTASQPGSDLTPPR